MAVRIYCKMAQTKLYKYLDANGGLMMLSNSNLQFSNAMKLNDPFDCHPALIDFSDVPQEKCKYWQATDISDLESDRYRRYRENAWICSLSKVHDSLLMWSYYNNHKGVCIGLDMEKTRKYLSHMHGRVMIGCLELDVQYKDIAVKPDFFREPKDYFSYQMSTKAKDWKHEQEVRLLILDPSPLFMRLMPCQEEQEEPIDWKEIRAYPEIGGECFNSIYLGFSMDKSAREKMIDTALNLNPNIRIYQMTIDPEALRLKEKRLDVKYDKYQET